MSQDIISDALNQIMNAKRVEKKEVKISRHSKLLINIFKIMKERKHIDYVIDEENKSVNVQIINLNECKAVKPRYFVSSTDIDKYLRRFLPSRNFGDLVISTNKGLLTHKEALKNKIGGSIIAYFY